MRRASNHGVEQEGIATRTYGFTCVVPTRWRAPRCRRPRSLCLPRPPSGAGVSWVRARRGGAGKGSARSGRRVGIVFSQVGLWRKHSEAQRVDLYGRSQPGTWHDEVTADVRKSQSSSAGWKLCAPVAQPSHTTTHAGRSRMGGDGSLTDRLSWTGGDRRSG